MLHYRAPVRREKATTIEALLLRGVKTLELAQPDERTCRECGQMFRAAFIIQHVCDGCVQVHVRLTGEQYRQKVAEDRLFRLRQFGLEKRLTEMTLDSFQSSHQPKAIEEARAFVALWPNVHALAFLGTPGTGKTHLACGVLLELVEMGTDVRYVHLPTLSAELKMATDWQQAASAAIKPLFKAGTIVLDDVGREKRTESLPEMIDALINQRWVAGAPMILTANMSESDLFGTASQEGWMSRAAASRFGSEATVVKMKAGDRRILGVRPAPVRASRGDPMKACETCAGAGWIRDDRCPAGNPNRLAKCPSCDGRGF